MLKSSDSLSVVLLQPVAAALCCAPVLHFSLSAERSRSNNLAMAAISLLQQMWHTFSCDVCITFSSGTEPTDFSHVEMQRDLKLGGQDSPILTFPANFPHPHMYERSGPWSGKRHREAHACHDHVHLVTHEVRRWSTNYAASHSLTVKCLWLLDLCNVKSKSN